MKTEIGEIFQVIIGVAIFSILMIIVGYKLAEKHTQKALTEKQWEQTKEGREVFNQLKETGLEVIDNLTEENEQLKRKIVVLEEQKKLYYKELWSIDNTPNARVWNEAFESLYKVCGKEGHIPYHFASGTVFRQSELLDNIYTLTTLMRKKPIIRKWGDKIGPNGEMFCE